MAKGFKHGAGGVNSLNFKVVGGTSAPTNPKENTLWAKTSNKITSYDFSTTQPSEPQEGTLWIGTNKYSSVEFNALKKNSIQVQPLFAEQYVAGEWVDVPCQLYKDGNWEDLTIPLIKNGVDNTKITGGWKTRGTNYNGYAASNTLSYKTGEGFINFSGGGGYFYTENTFDLTDVTTLVADATWSGGNESYSFLCIVPVGGVSDLVNMISRTAHPNYNKGRGQIRIDISALSGNYRIGVGCWDEPTRKVHDMWLEK